MIKYINADNLIRELQPYADRPTKRAIAMIGELKGEEVTPVVHAHWNKTRFMNIYQCSACKSQDIMEMLRCAVYLKRYCPNCGAKMDEEEQDAEIH